MKEREAREQNVIIHGLPEEANSLEGRVADNQSIKDSLTAIGVSSEPRSISRIGERNDAICRPIKLIMAINNEKDLVISSLSKLKEAPDKFKRTSVTDDYTAKEREEIRKMVVEAKSKTALEGEGKFVFKVRGTPKDGLVIRRFASNHNLRSLKNITRKGIKFKYTNADQFINKKEDLVMFISNDKPKIMIITEVIPKKQENPITQELLDIEGYKCALNFDPYEPNLGASGIRGVAIYYSDSLIVSEVKFNADGQEDHFGLS